MIDQAIKDFAAQTTDSRELLCAASEHVISYIEDNFDSFVNQEMTETDEMRDMIEQLVEDIIDEKIVSTDETVRYDMLVDIRCTREAIEDLLDDINASKEFQQIVSETFYMIFRAAKFEDQMID